VRTVCVLLAVLCAVAAPRARGADSPDYATVVPNVALVFPRDHGSHPQHRTEWWYITGWLTTSEGEALGFQVTFFRTRPEIDTANPSAFTPRQLIIAHAAISDVKRGRLWKDQRIARAGFGLADAALTDTQVWLDRWRLARSATAYTAQIEAEGFGLSLELAPTQAPMLNGANGFSQKGPALRSASYYYSMPHLRVTGTVSREGQAQRVSGEAWLDHEWSSEYLDAEARGWDWVGINLADGGALMAFRMRDRQGNARWAGGSLRGADGGVRVLAPDAIAFVPGRRWRSPRTGTEYPVEWQLQAGDLSIALRPLMDDQESDARASTGAVYWEGAVTALRDGLPIGRGYLELTGYGEPLRLR
jgi:predicted secreted hydrolase